MANNISVRDGTGVLTTVQTTDNTSVHLPAHQLRDSTGANAASVSAAGAVKVDGSAVTQPVSGTVSISGTIAATQSGTWNIGTVTTVTTVATLTTITNPVAVTQSTSPWIVAGGGTAGSAATGVVTVQGIASMTPVATNLTQILGSAAVSGSGTATGALRVELPTNGTGVVGLNAGTALIGSVAAANVTGTVYQGTTARTPVFVSIAASSSGNNTIVAADGSLKIRVLAVQLTASAAVNAKWQSGASGTDLTGLAYFAANGGYVLPYNPAGWFETAAATLLNLNLSGAVPVGGSLTYILVS